MADTCKTEAELLAELRAVREELEELRAAHQRLHVILNRVADGVTVQDTSGALVYANDSAARICGYPSSSALLAAPLHEIWSRFALQDEAGRPFSTQQLPGRLVLAGMRNPPETTVRVRYLETDEERWSTIRATPVEDEHGRLTAVINSWHDTTMLKQREAELAEQREYLAVTLASIGDGVIVTDPQGTVTFLNGVAQKLTGWTQPAALGRPIDLVFRLVSEQTRQPVEHPVAHALGDGRVAGLGDSTLLIAQDGREVPVDGSSAPLLAADGSLLGLVFAFRDVSTRKRAEKMQRFLLEASTTLASSLDYRQTLSTLARLAVPVVADWCAVDILDEQGTIRRLAVVHNDPSRVALAHELQRRYPPAPDSRYGVPQVVRSGQPLLHVVVSDAMLEAAAQDEDHLRMLREVGLTSYMAVPVIVRGQVLGAITFAIAESGRQYTAEDLLLAQDLAARAAIAIDNARLYKHAQEQLAQRTAAEQQLRLITDSLPVLIAYVDAQQRYLFVNQEYERWFNNRREDVLGKHLRDVIGPAGYELVRGYIERVLAGETVTYETTIPYQYGGVRAIQGVLVPDRDEQGAVRGYFALITDIAKRKQDEEALRLQAQVLECMSEGVSVCTEEGIIVYTNPAEDAMFGYAPGELIGQHVTIQNTYPPEENVRIVAEVIDELRRTGVWKGEFHNKKKDGTPFVTYAHITRLDLEDKHYLVCVQEDITAQKRIEAERQRLLDDEQQARKEAEVALRLRDQFLSLAAHELKTPMTTILGSAQLMQRQLLRSDHSSARERARVETMIAQIQRLNRLISSLLDLTRIQEGRLTIERAPVDLCAVVRQLVEEIQPTLTLHSITLHSPSAPCIVVGDRLRLEQVIQNLVQNAVKYSPEGGTIELVVERRGSLVCLAIRDQGIGIPADEQSRIFDRFFRARNVNARQLSGMGIGLYVVHEIVGLHGGTVGVESTEGRGSTFTVSLPQITTQTMS